MNGKLRNYQSAEILGKSGADLVVSVYDGAISNLREAMEYYKSGVSEKGYDKIEKTRRFIIHLYTTLDEKSGGSVAEGLSRLYAFIVEKINLIQATRETRLIEDIIIILENIREGWIQLAKETRYGRAAVAGTRQQESPATGISISI
jgi:flagellar protein FliS